MTKFLRFAQYLCALLVAIGLTITDTAYGQHQHYLDSSNFNELYRHTDEPLIEVLPHGDSESANIKFDKPVHFYSETYDDIYINTNGILTFMTEFPEYLNQPFPLEYPSISPFYSNVDTSTANDSTVISIFKSEKGTHLQKASGLIRYSYPNEFDFIAKTLYVATWENVGYFDGKTDKLNTFQAIIIASDEETYVQFIYPSGGINWLQADTGELGLPDIRAQAGFISVDGRFFNIDGSGTDNARYFSERSNVGVNGVYLFRVGQIEYNENVQEPFNEETITESHQSLTCAESGNRQCHSIATCIDKSDGFCCKCPHGYYGNGESCIKNTVPIRVTGSLSGTINNQPIGSSAKLQSYIVMQDGRSYTAVNPISPELGAQLKLALPVVGSIGWLFAKPVSTEVLNGYQLTGGKLQHNSKLTFNSGEVLLVNQTFDGLNYWDQLTVDIVISGNVPQTAYDAKFQMNDYIEEFRYTSADSLVSTGGRTIEIVSLNQAIGFQLDQVITFDRCMLDDEADPTGTTFLQKVSKVNLEYFAQDQALRTGILTKVGVDTESNPCTDGTATCGPNALCVPEEDSYSCTCVNGFTPQLLDNDEEICVDIDECSTGIHICDENAECGNTAGGYICVCRGGYVGNGHTCDRLGGNHIVESTTVIDIHQAPAENEEDSDDRNREQDFEDRRNEDEETPEEQDLERQPESSNNCVRCAKDANCINGRCECREGHHGDGYVCYYNCRPNVEVWEDGKCVPVSEEESEVEVSCNIFGFCSCPDGYDLSDDNNRTICKSTNSGSQGGRDSDIVPCDVDESCHEHAACEWSEQEMQHICVCIRGFVGDGFTCNKTDESCTTNPDLCDVHATCEYNEFLGRSECQCEARYQGNGLRCELAPECQADTDCGASAYCDRGVCQCIEGYERDLSDFCVPAGLCGGTYCADNAMCKWDPKLKVQYCECMEGYTGNGVESCKSIPISCNVRNTCGVHASCHLSMSDFGQYECVCDPGFYGDGFVCIEEQNCQNTPEMCDRNARCTSTNSGVSCVCNPGYLGNGTQCRERPTHDSGFLLISQGVVIVRVPFNGKFGRPISVASMAIGLDKDCVEGRVYWGDISAKKIISAKYDGTDSRPFITEDIESPEGIAIDSVSRRIYWTDSVKDTVEVANLEDPTIRAVLVNKYLVNPRGIAVDPYRQKLYWSDWNRESPKIEMADLDGTAREILVSKPSVLLPNSLVVLKDSGELCFADAGSHKIECIDSFSKQVRTVAFDLSYPFGLTSTDNNFYWTDWTTKKLESVDVTGKRQQGMRTPVFGSHKMYGMTAVVEDCPQDSSPCQLNNGGCPDSRICLSNRKAPSGKSCKCTKLSKMCNGRLYDENTDQFV